MMDRQEEAESVLDFLARPENLRNRGVCNAALTGLLVVLADQREALLIACEHDSALQGTVDQFAQELEQWRKYRHDAAHLAERLFRAQRTGANDPTTQQGTAQAFRFDPNTQTVQTGEGPILALRDAVAQSKVIIEQAKSVVGL